MLHPLEVANLHIHAYFGLGPAVLIRPYFILPFSYPRDVPEEEALHYEAMVEWRADQHRLYCAVALNGAVMTRWRSTQTFFEGLTRRLKLVMPPPMEGRLAPCPVEGPVAGSTDPARFAPSFRTVFVCPKALGERELAVPLHKALLTSIYALRFALPIFSHIAEHGEEPSVEQQVRMLLIEQGMCEVFSCGGFEYAPEPQGYAPPCLLN